MERTSEMHLIFVRFIDLNFCLQFLLILWCANYEHDFTIRLFQILISKNRLEIHTLKKIIYESSLLITKDRWVHESIQNQTNVLNAKCYCLF